MEAEFDEQMDREAEEWRKAHPEEAAASAKAQIAWYAAHPSKDPDEEDALKIVTQELAAWYAEHPGQEPLGQKKQDTDEQKEATGAAEAALDDATLHRLLMRDEDE